MTGLPSSGFQDLSEQLRLEGVDAKDAPAAAPPKKLPPDAWNRCCYSAAF